MINKEITNNKN